MEHQQTKQDTKRVLAKLEALEESKDMKIDKAPELSLEIQKALGLVGY